MKQTRWLSEFSRLSKYTQLYPIFLFSRIIQSSIDGRTSTITMTAQISLFYASDGKEWAVYLADAFHAKDGSLEIDLKPIETSIPGSTSHDHVKIYMITPKFLEWKPDVASAYCDSVKSIAVLTGVEREDWFQFAKANKTGSLLHWRVYEVLDDESSVSRLIFSITSLYKNNNHDTHQKPSGTVRKEYIKKTDRIDDGCCQNISSHTSEYSSPCSRPVNAVRHVFKQVSIGVGTGGGAAGVRSTQYFCRGWGRE